MTTRHAGKVDRNQGVSMWIRHRLALLVALILAATTGLVVGQDRLKVVLWGLDSCGGGLDQMASGKQQVVLVPEAVVWRPGNPQGVPARHLWVTAINPLDWEQDLFIETVGLTSTPHAFTVPPNDRIKVDIGDPKNGFVPAGVSADFGLKMTWGYHGAVDVISWDAGFAIPSHPTLTFACRHAFYTPYGN